MAVNILNTFGKKCSEVDASFLTCLDKNKDSAGDAKEFEEADEDSTLVGSRYTEKVRLCN